MEQKSSGSHGRVSLLVSTGLSVGVCLAALLSAVYYNTSEASEGFPRSLLELPADADMEPWIPAGSWLSRLIPVSVRHSWMASASSDSSSSSSYTSSFLRLLLGDDARGTEYLNQALPTTHLLQMLLLCLIIMSPTILYILWGFIYGYGIMMVFYGAFCLQDLFSAPFSSFWKQSSSSFTSPLSVSASSWLPLLSSSIYGFVTSCVSALSESHFVWLVTAAVASLYILYGVRICSFAFYREFFSESFRKHLPQRMEDRRIKNPTVASRLLVGLFMTCLLTLFQFPLLYLRQLLFLSISASSAGRRTGGELDKTNQGASAKASVSSSSSKSVLLTFSSDNHAALLLAGVQLAGLVMCLGGLLVEQTADCQKLRQKEQALRARTRAASKPRVMSTGLYRYCQQPNYFAELVFQFGLIAASSGILCLHSVPKCLLTVTAPLTMFAAIQNSSLVLHDEQHRRYAGDRDFEEYRKQTNVLLFDVRRLFADVFEKILSTKNRQTIRKRRVGAAASSLTHSTTHQQHHPSTTTSSSTSSSSTITATATTTTAADSTSDSRPTSPTYSSKGRTRS